MDKTLRGYISESDESMSANDSIMSVDEQTPTKQQPVKHVEEYIDLTKENSDNDDNDSVFDLSPEPSQGKTLLSSTFASTTKPVSATSTKTLGMKPMGTVTPSIHSVLEKPSSTVLARKSNEGNEPIPLGRPVNQQMALSSRLMSIKHGSNEQHTPRRERQELAQQLLELKQQMDGIKKALSGASSSSLHDNGLRLQLKLSKLKLENNRIQKKYREANEKVESYMAEKMLTQNTEGTKFGQQFNNPYASSFENLPIAKQEPYKRPGTTVIAENLTGDALVRLHSSLQSSPIDNGVSDPGPRGLRVELLPHQQKAMSWLLWREQQHPKGGILADDMGLGKTLTMIALILRSKELHANNQENHHIRDNLKKGGTLVVCPMSVLKQWEAEIKNRCERNLLSVLVYHGKDRAIDVSRLARKDIVLTTYNIVGREGQGPKTPAALEGLEPFDPQGLLYSVHWERVILDEAHIIRNPKTQGAKGVYQLRSTFRWCLTGTPVHNKLLDLYSLICFLKFTPFNDERVWRRCAENKSAMGTERLNAIMKSILLRRTKQDLQNEGELQCLPSKEIHTIEVELEPEENKVYQHILKQSRTLMAKFIMQRAEKQVETGEDVYAIEKAMQELAEKGIIDVRKKHPSLEDKVQASQILVQLLRLRQICCHPCLVKSKIDDEVVANDGIEDKDEFMNVVANLKRLSVLDDEKSSLDPSNPVFDSDRKSSKLRAVIRLVKELKETGEKIILVSQWTAVLDIVEMHLKRIGIRSTQFNGKLNPEKRQDILHAFNQENAGPKVLLLSLTAGGTGVNLIGGNHMILLDIHWNPQLEAQAMDRIYRVGQKRDVHIYRYICSETVEQSIQAIQEKKLQIAHGILNCKNKTRLEFEDLKTLFMI